MDHEEKLKQLESELAAIKALLCENCQHQRSPCLCRGNMMNLIGKLNRENRQLRKALETRSNGDHQGCNKARIPEEGECPECVIERALGTY